MIGSPDAARDSFATYYVQVLLSIDVSSSKSATAGADASHTARFVLRTFDPEAGYLTAFGELTQNLDPVRVKTGMLHVGGD